MHMYFSNIMDDYTLPPSYDGSLGILQAWTSWKLKGLPKPVQGLLNLYLYV